MKTSILPAVLLFMTVFSFSAPASALNGPEFEDCVLKCSDDATKSAEQCKALFDGSVESGEKMNACMAEVPTAKICVDRCKETA